MTITRFYVATFNDFPDKKPVWSDKLIISLKGTKIFKILSFYEIFADSTKAETFLIFI